MFLMMDYRDIRVRNATYQLFVELRRAPATQEVADFLRVPFAEVQASWHRLHDEHAIVLNEFKTELRMANPFSAVPSAYRVSARGFWWYANCAWDAFGICAALHADGRIETSCPDCLEPLAIDVQGALPSRTDLLFHCLVPARHWWDDIVFT